MVHATLSWLALGVAKLEMKDCCRKPPWLLAGVLMDVCRLMSARSLGYEKDCMLFATFY